MELDEILKLIGTGAGGATAAGAILVWLLKLLAGRVMTQLDSMSQNLNKISEKINFHDFHITNLLEATKGLKEFGRVEFLMEERQKDLNAAFAKIRDLEKNVETCKSIHSNIEGIDDQIETLRARSHYFQNKIMALKAAMEKANIAVPTDTEMPR